MKYRLMIIFFCALSVVSFGQEKIKEKEMKNELPYFEIPDYPDEYNEFTVLARIIDGLGYRYYWATESLREEDLEFRPSESGRSVKETMEHIKNLSNGTLKGILTEPIERSEDPEEYSYAELREITLNNLKQASDYLRLISGGSMEEMKIIFKRGDQSSEFPVWHLMNGMIADALWHVGQIVSHRRTSGNPLDSGVSVFSGKTRGR